MLAPAQTPPLTTEQQYAEYVNPEWVKLLDILGINQTFERGRGTELFAENGEVYLDFLSGYGIYNIGHHHPYISEQLIKELQSQRPTMLQSDVPTLAAQLAERLCQKVGGKLGKMYFGCSGSEGVESSIKFARAFTKRDWILYADGAFHGLTCGALSLMGSSWWREGFGNLLQETQSVPYGDIESLRATLATEKYAMLILEPVQGESGVVVPTKEYLQEAQALCEKHGTLLVIDEVQTGIHRTGQFLASHHYELEPDMVIIAKALSGGQVPISVLLMRDDVSHSVYSSVDKAFVHASTFSENTLAMRAGLATLDVVERENTEQTCLARGEFFRAELNKRLARFEIVKEVRGLGMMNAIEFHAPKSLALKTLYKTFQRVHPGLFGQMVVRSLFRDHKIVAQIAGHNHSVLKLIPPVNISEKHILVFTEAIENLCETMVSDKTKFWKQGAQIGAKAFSKKIAK